MRQLQHLFPFQSFMIISLIACLFFSCNNAPEPLPLETMSKILTEMYVAESYAQFVPKDSTQLDSKNQDSIKKYVSAILFENNTNETAFKQSIDWYKSRPELFDSIYQQVLTDLAIWQTKVDRK